MKLTNHIRGAFVRAAMADVPSIDHRELAQKLAQRDALSQMPPAIAALHADSALRSWLNTHNLRLPGSWGYERVVVYGMNDFELSAAAEKEIRALGDAADAQTLQHSELKSKIASAAAAVTTRKALVDMLPEFEKYLPADDAAACKTLPAVANMMSEFIKAGWPKGATPA